MNFSRLRLGVGLALVLGLATAAAGLAQSGSPAASPTPLLSPAPLATPSSGPRRGRRSPGPAPSGSPSAKPTESPEPPQFTTLDGVWEVELQPLGQRLASYSYLGITATGASITGYWQSGRNKPRLPMAGTFDGRLISMSFSLPNGNTATFNGYVETFADMVGLYRTSDKDPGTAFTAQHRKKLKG